MNRTGRRRLRLAVETVRILGIRELHGVVGGESVDCPDTSMVHPTVSVESCKQLTDECKS